MSANKKSGKQSSEKCPVGIHESVEVAVIGINLDSACKKVSRIQKWNTAKIAAVEKKHREMITNLALALEGCGVVSCVENEVGLLWQAHCGEGQKYAADMLAVAQAVGAFRGKSQEEKFPGPGD